MDAAQRVTLLAGLVLVLVHVTVTLANGLSLPESVQEKFGASPVTTFTRAWAHFTAPFFHYGLLHITFNLTLLALTFPHAARAFGPGRALALTYFASPLTGMLVNTLVILPLADAGVAYAERIVDYRFVGASVIAYASAGLALASTQWPLGGKAAAAGGVLAFEAALAVLTVTRPFVGVYHVTGFLIGFGTGAALTAIAGR